MGSIPRPYRQPNAMSKVKLPIQKGYFQDIDLHGGNNDTMKDEGNFPFTSQHINESRAFYQHDQNDIDMSKMTTPKTDFQMKQEQRSNQYLRDRSASGMRDLSSEMIRLGSGVGAGNVNAALGHNRQLEMQTDILQKMNDENNANAIN